MTMQPQTLKNAKNSHSNSCITTKAEKLNDSTTKTTFTINNPKKISKLDTSKQALIEAKTEYLFLLKYPVSITQKLKIIDKSDA